jgi:hypothetical protein
MRNSEARFKGKEIAFVNGVYYRCVDDGAWDELANTYEWNSAESQLVREHYERALDRIETFLGI